jgi:hypothetical protein
VPVIDAVEVAAVTTTAVVELLPDNAYADLTAVPVAPGPVYTASCAVVKLVLAFATMMLCTLTLPATKMGAIVSATALRLTPWAEAIKRNA